MVILRHRRIIEREVKMMLLEEARRRGVDLRALVEWLREEFGINARPDWRSVERAIASPEVSSNELASFLMEQGVDIPEEKWLEILRKHGLRV